MLNFGRASHSSSLCHDMLLGCLDDFVRCRLATGHVRATGYFRTTANHFGRSVPACTTGWRGLFSGSVFFGTDGRCIVDDFIDREAFHLIQIVSDAIVMILRDQLLERHKRRRSPLHLDMCAHVRRLVCRGQVDGFCEAATLSILEAPSLVQMGIVLLQLFLRQRIPARPVEHLARLHHIRLLLVVVRQVSISDILAVILGLGVQ